MAIVRKIKFVPAILGCMVMVSGCGSNTQAPTTEVVAQQEITTTPVEVMEVTQSSIENKYMYSGAVKPVNEVNVLSTLNGTVNTVNYEVGDYVHAGDVLFTMDTEDIQNNIKVTEASLATAEASINTAKTNLEYVNGAAMQSQIISAKNSVENAKSSVENAKISLSNAELSYNTAKNDYESYKALYEAGAIAKATFDQYELNYKKAELGLEQAKVSLQQAEAGLQTAKESYEIITVKTPEENLRKAQDALASAEASKASILAQIESYQKTLRDATIIAPISGTIAQCNVKASTVLTQTGSAPFVIIDLSSVNIEVNVAEQLIPNIKVGDEVEVVVSTISLEPMVGNIGAINPVANTDGTYTVKIKIHNEDGKLKSGMFGEVYFAKEKSQDTIVLPRQAILTKDDTYYVFVEQEGIAIRTEVEVGIDNGDVIEVTSGLTVGSKVITKGQSYLVDGDKVHIVEANINTDEETKETDTVDTVSGMLEAEESPSQKEA